MSTYSKIIDGKRWYWHGWTSSESSAIQSKEMLTTKGKIVKIEKGIAGRHGVYKAGEGHDAMGYHIYYK